MRPTIYINHPQPTQWSPGMSACMGGIEAIQHSLDCGTGSPKSGFEKNPLTQEAGR